MAVLTACWVRRLRSAALVSALGAAAVPASGQPPPSVGPGPLASAHRAIATRVPAAQTAFDRGLIMLYAFNVGEARTAFRAAERADPHALMPYVGEAVAETIDINLPTTADGERRGADAVRRASQALAPETPPDERALLAAVAARYDLVTGQQRRFSDYADALDAYTRAYPTDGLGLTLAAYARWNATGVLTTGPHDELTADAKTIASDLDAALALDPSDVGAHHLRIHFWEQALHPERALSDALFLTALSYAPGESHLPHMAGHIYDRLGDYAAMIRVNETACANDDGYFKTGDGDGPTYMRSYHEHDVDFVLYGLTTLGQNAAARAFAARDSAYAREIVGLRVHDARAVLAELGAAVTPMRVVAEARAGDLDAARKDFAGLPHAAGTPGADIDYDLAAAALARADHDDGGAIAAYRRAQAASGTTLGDPKNRWWTPIGEGLGATLLEAGQPAEAERTFRAELARYPNDPRLEFGLARALAAQGKDDAEPLAAAQANWHGVKPLTLDDLG